MRAIHLIIVLGLVLLAFNRFATFPVLGYHGHACLCDRCLDEADAERGEEGGQR